MSTEEIKKTADLKLNVKRTFIIGFAFFGILLLWQVYDAWCPTFLTELFGKTFYGNDRFNFTPYFWKTFR